MHVLPEVLVERLTRRQVVLVAGLGCSRVAGFPAWKELCERLADWIEADADKQAVLDLVRNDRLASAAALLRDMVSESAFVEVLRDAYPLHAQAPAGIQAIARAPWRGIITTALDGLWSAALAGDAEVANRMVFAGNASALESGHGRFLIQLFGRHDVPASLCLAPFEIGPKIVGTGASKYLESLHKKWSFVFVGCEPSDPDLAWLAGRILGASASTLEHFFVAPSLSAMDARRVKTEFGLTPVSIEGGLPEVLDALAQACQAASAQPGVDEVEAWLERLGADHGDNDARAMLEQGLAKLGEDKEWDRLVGVLIGRAELQSDPDDQAEDLHQAALVLDEKLSAPDRAYPVLMMALRLTPNDEKLLADAKRAADSAGQSKEFLHELHDIDKESVHSPHSDRMSLGVARILADDPKQREEAIAAFRKVLDRDPDNAQAMEDLEAILRKAERWDALGELLEKAADRNPQDAAIAAKLEQLYERTHKIPQLVELLQQRLARNPDDDSASSKLENLYQQEQRWQPLSSLYERRLDRQPNDPKLRSKLEALYQRTQQWQPLGVLYERQLAEDPEDAAVLAKMEDLYRRSEQWRPLADLLEWRASKKDAAQARAAHLECASIFLDKVKDIEGALAVARDLLPTDEATAEDIFAKCLDRDPGNPTALLALADLTRNKGDHLRAAKFLLRAAERTQNPLELGRLLAEAGSIYLDHLNDEAKASELFAQALAADPEQSSAAARLLALHEKGENWTAVEPLLDFFLRKTEEGPGKSDLYQRSARCARKLGKLDKAALALAAAAKYLPNSLTVTCELADLRFEQGAFAEARAGYEKALSLLGPKATAAERAALDERLATAAVRSGDREAGMRFYKEALTLEPEKQSTLEALIELYAARGDWKDVVDLKRRLVALVDDETKARIFEEIGDILHEKLGDRRAGLKAYLQTLAVQPDRRSTLHKALDHYTYEREWSSAIATLTKLSSLEIDAPTRARYNYAAAAIYRDELKDNVKAIELFTLVLEDNALHPKAFDAVEKLLAESKEWKELERAYRKQIKRLPQDAPTELKLRLWDGLADVALKQHDKESAALTLKVAVSLAPDNMARQERLAKLYFDMGPSAAENAIAQNQYLLTKQPDRLESYRALAALFYQSGAHDKMWCVAGALTCLGKADPPLQALYENFRPSQAPNTTNKLNEELWRKILHPSENTYLSALLALLSPAIAAITAQPHKVLGLDRQARVDVAGNNWSYAAALRYVANTIEMPLPDVFIKRDAPGTASLVNLKEKNTLTPALVIGIGFEQLTSLSQVIFDLAKRMVLLRPERFPRFALGTASGLEIAVRAGLQLAGTPIGPGEHGDEVDRMAKQLEGKLADALRTELKGLGKKYLETCGNKLDIATWIGASDLTASRAALVLCGDVVAACRVLALEPSGQSPLSAQERMGDLLSYFVSDDHFAVRAALGLQVNLPTMGAQPDTQPKRRMSHVQVKTP
jgi:tetratricopeptide (TPR) repeat protein